MEQPNCQDYYAARAATSRDLAQRAENPAIAAIHAEFAVRYDRLAAPQERGDVPLAGSDQAT